MPAAGRPTSSVPPTRWRWRLSWPAGSAFLKLPDWSSKRSSALRPRLCRAAPAIGRRGDRARPRRTAIATNWLSAKGATEQEERTHEWHWLVDRASGVEPAATSCPFLFVLTIVVFFHELGHFLVARWCGVAVKIFSIGFGPELIGFNDRKGTRWRLSLIPLGGYVRFFGDENEASLPNRDALAPMDPADQRTLVRRQGRRHPGGHRRRRPDRQFRAGDRHLHGDLQHLRPRGDDPAGRFGGGRQRRPRKPASSPATWSNRSTAAGVALSRPAARRQRQRGRHPSRSWSAAATDVTCPAGSADRNRSVRQQNADGHARRQPCHQPRRGATEHYSVPVAAAWVAPRKPRSSPGTRCPTLSGSSSGANRPTRSAARSGSPRSRPRSPRSASPR